ncbi:hypothetical protein D9615_004500 [Tricholomella constricta]|uniref:Essential protein Yae1 N-terminal domain-containing protein n=1 Tax=Tricholomella constricta TaxID=117010 RepID=A0A8H5M3Z7_9AGAR|nr:hypothetical protein D9615_004500 [Tricholomella constricta]
MPEQGINSQSNAPILEVPKLRSGGHDVVFQLREAAAAPSSVLQFLEDPAVVEFSRMKNKSGAKDSRKMTSIIQLALVEEERQVQHLKALLRNAAGHLEYEIRRADDAELRAHYAESNEKQVSTKLVEAESAILRAEAERERSVSESQQYQIELESAERELQCLKIDVRRAERLKDGFEEANTKAEELNIHYRNKLSKWQIREDTIQHEHQIEMMKSFDEGWTEGNEEGFKEGRNYGYQEGRIAGRTEGLREGKERGQIEEREKALEAFDKFLNEEMGYDDSVSFYR